MDWTRIGKDCEEEDEHAIRLPIDVVPEDAFDPDDDHLAIIGTSGKKVTKIGGLEGLKLRIICLRSHLIEVRRGVRMWEYATYATCYVIVLASVRARFHNYKRQRVNSHFSLGI